MSYSTRPVPVGPKGLEPEPLLGIYIPRAPRLPSLFFLVSLPVTRCTPMPAATVDVEGQALTEWRAAS